MNRYACAQYTQKVTIQYGGVVLPAKLSTGLMSSMCCRPGGMCEKKRYENNS